MCRYSYHVAFVPSLIVLHFHYINHVVFLGTKDRKDQSVQDRKIKRYANGVDDKNRDDKTHSEVYIDVI